MRRTIRTAPPGRQARSPRRPWAVLLLGSFAGCLLLPAVGCGPSQEDLMMRAARRQRPPDAGEQASKLTTPEPTALAAGVEREVSQPSRPEDSANGSKQQTDSSGQSPAAAVAAASEPTPATAQPVGQLLPIEQRKPQQPLSAGQRRARALENLEKISAALEKYYAEKNIFPRSYSKSSSGISTLSWRVEILPYLGYQDLYRRFDRKQPWNREPNKSLLQYIPDEFVSPERFDTKTNYLLPAHRMFMFGDNKARAAFNVDDGIDNTILLVEVNDNLAVPWTQPGDYDPEDVLQMQNDLGELRGDGAFAVWGNGIPVLLGNSLRSQQLLNAFTYDSGDGQRAGTIHQGISTDPVAETSVAVTPTPPTPQATASAPASATTVRRPPAHAEMVCQPVPRSRQIAEAQRKLRVIFADRIREADDDRKLARLAGEMVREAGNLRDDLPGMYALQSAAMRLAIDSNSIDVLIDAIDHRVGMFEVDAYEENVVNLLDFGKAAASQDDESIRRTELLRRAIRVIRAGIADDDYIRTATLAQMAVRFAEDSRGKDSRSSIRDSRQLARESHKDVIPRLFTRLRSSLGNAEREYEQAKDELQQYRANSDNVDAGAAVGRFLCFIKGDWNTGLPLLAAGGPQQLRQVAAQELRGARIIDEIIGLGDAWWYLSEQAREDVYRQGAQDRAVYWYQQAFDVLPDSLDKMHVKARIDEAVEIEATSPLALCHQLALELGVNLEVGLEDVSGAARRRVINQAGQDEYD